MAHLSFSGLEELHLSMEEVAEIPDDVVEDMLNAGADVLIPEIKARGEGYGVEDTGLTLESLTKSRARKNVIGMRCLSIYFKGSRVRGKDKKGEPKRIKNSEIAFLSAYGTRKHPARPFVQDALTLSERTVTCAMADVYDKFLKSKGL